MDLLACKNKRYLMYIHQNYAYSMLRPIQKLILEHGGEVKWFLATRDIDSQYLQSNEPRALTIAEINAWQPDAVIVPGNVVPSFILGVKVAVFHGFNAGKRNSRDREDHFEIRNCFDLYCTQGPNTTNRFIELSRKHGHFDVIETGWANLDPLFHSGIDNPYQDQTEPRPTLLFCSTFSAKYSCANKIINTIKELRDSERWRILVQFHPKMDKRTINSYKKLQNNNLTFIETDNVLPLLKAADVMLCDTSSILYMFLLLHKPVVTFNHQFPAPYLINVIDENELRSALEMALSQPKQLMMNIEQYCQQLHPYRDGRSAERVLASINGLIDKGTSHLAAKPFNLIRELKQRKQLNYWRFC